MKFLIKKIVQLLGIRIEELYTNEDIKEYIGNSKIEDVAYFSDLENWARDNDFKYFGY